MKGVALVIVLAVLPLACSSKPSGPEKITMARALDLATKAAGEGIWLVGFVSNSGHRGSVTSQQLSGAAEGLMDRDGRAGQWVIGVFKDEPSNYEDKQLGRKGKSYPYKEYLVTAAEVVELPGEGRIAVPERLVAIPPNEIASADAARTLAIQEVKVEYGVLSIASDYRPDGHRSWRFRFYEQKSESLVAKVNVSCDGATVLPW